MSPLCLLSTYLVVGAPQLSESSSSLLEWMSPLSLLSTFLVVDAPQISETASEAFFGAAC